MCFRTCYGPLHSTTLHSPSFVCSRCGAVLILPYEELYCTLLFLSTCIAALMQLDMFSVEPAPSPHVWAQEAVQKQEAGGEAGVKVMQEARTAVASARFTCCAVVVSSRWSWPLQHST